MLEASVDAPVETSTGGDASVGGSVEASTGDAAADTGAAEDGAGDSPDSGACRAACRLAETTITIPATVRSCYDGSECGTGMSCTVEGTAEVEMAFHAEANGARVTTAGTDYFYGVIRMLDDEFSLVSATPGGYRTNSTVATECYEDGYDAYEYAPLELEVECETGRIEIESICWGLDYASDLCSDPSYRMELSGSVLRPNAVVPTECVDCDGRQVDTLTDLDHCGECDNFCAGECSGGLCMEELSGYAQSVRMTDTHVYWSGGGFSRVPVTGGDVEVVGGSSSFYDTRWAIGDSHIFYYFYRREDEPPSYIFRVPISGGEEDEFWLPSAPARTIAADSNHVYWSDVNGTVWRVPQSGGAEVELASGQTVTRMLVVDGVLFWTGSNAVWMLPVEGGSPTAIPDSGGGFRIAADTSHVYWTSSSSVMRAPLAGGAATVVTDVGVTAVTGIASDGVNVYVTTGDTLTTNRLWKAPATGGDAELVSLFDEALGVVVSDSAVYVTGTVGESLLGGVTRITPK